jgi:hypothetical protein
MAAHAALTAAAAAAPVSAPAAAGYPPGTSSSGVGPGAPDPIEAQPTIPVRTLEEAYDAAAQAEAASPARVVVLTTELAGLEFSLNRASLVMGRTDENEIVLNHRSISRHHAKIVREGDHYTIVDLQSANGVRVNGEDYERIELHPGDVIELGHVKLRFVGPLEHYAFDPDTRFDRGRFPVKIAAVLGGAAVLVVVGLALQRGRSRSNEAEGAPLAASTPGTATSSAPAAPPAAATTPAPQSAPPTPEALMAEATRAAGSEDWQAARSALDRMGPPSVDPTARRQAADLRHRVEMEGRAALAFARFDEAQTANSYADAVARYNDIPGESVYKHRARGRYEQARALLITEHLTAAEKARTAGRCVEARQEADAVEALDPQNQLAREMVRLCRVRPAEPPVAAIRPPRAKPIATLAAQTPRPERPERAEPAPRRSEGAAEPEFDADSLMRQAREAWLRQQCGSAIDISRKALRARPGMTDAYQIIAVCSCSLKDADGASRAYAKLDDKSRNLVHSLCQKNGIALGE